MFQDALTYPVYILAKSFNLDTAVEMFANVCYMMIQQNKLTLLLSYLLLLSSLVSVDTII